MRIVIVSGGFDPIHSGHIEHFKEAKKLGDILIVGLNSDEWLTRKKGKPFMPIQERLAVIRELRMVDSAVAFNDDNNSSIDLIKKALVLFDDVLFANGEIGHRTIYLRLMSLIKTLGYSLHSGLVVHINKILVVGS